MISILIYRKKFNISGKLQNIAKINYEYFKIMRKVIPTGNKHTNWNLEKASGLERLEELHYFSAFGYIALF